MGKISDALERQQNERAIETKMLHPEPGTQYPETNLQKPVSSFQDSFDPKLFTYTAPGSLEAENFKVLRGQILFRKDGSRPRTILVTSALPNEGKTFVASNLAVSIAQGVNEHVLVVDCDFSRPHLHNMFGYTNQEGLQEYLTRKKELPDLLIRTKIDKLSLLTAGGPVQSSSELLSSSRMKAFFEEVKGRYDDRYIIVDCSPSHLFAGVSVLSNYVDGIIFVVMAERSPRGIIKDCIEKYNLKIIGYREIRSIIRKGF